MLPRVYPQIRLPLFAVLAFSLSVVDVSLVLGPNTPPPLAVRLLGWFNDPDLQRRFMASAGALLQFALVLGALAGWWLLERVIKRAGLAWLRRGYRCRHDGALRAFALLLTMLCAALSVLGFMALALWSVATFWRFPAALPDGFTLLNWGRYSTQLAPALWQTVVVGVGSALRGHCRSHRTDKH